MPTSSGDGSSRTGWAGIALLAFALVAAVAAYWPGLSSPFVFDDERYVSRNLQLRHLWPPDWLHAGTQETRPLTNLSFALDIAAFGTGPRGHHAVNLALHLVSVLLLFAVVRRARVPDRWTHARDREALAASAALILALHPAQSTSVIYIQCRSGLLATVFGLAALLVAAGVISRWAAGRHRALGAGAVALLVALGALSKESGAVLPALVLLYDALLASRGDPRGLRERLVRLHLPVWAGLLPLALAYATLHNPHTGVFGPHVVDLLRFYATQPLVLLFYLRLYLWPSGLTVDRAFAMLSPVEPRAWLAAVALLVLLGIVLGALRRAPWAGFWALWWLAALAPTALVPSPDFAAERYLTLATPAAAVLAGGLLLRAAAWVAPRLRLAPASACAIAVLPLAAALGGATFGRAQVWRSDLALWREAVRVSPGNSRAWYQYALLLHAEDSLETADGAAHRALALGAREHLALILLSGIKASEGAIDSSLAFAAAAVRAAPWNAGAHVELARALARERRWAEAGREADTAVGLDAASRAARYLRGVARAERGDLAGARVDATELSRLELAPVEAAALAGLIAVRAGRPAEAEAWLSRATAGLPADRDESLAYIDASRSRAPLLLALGRTDEAIHSWQVYFTVTNAEHWDAASLRGIAEAFRAAGREREAASALRAAASLRPALSDTGRSSRPGP